MLAMTLYSTGWIQENVFPIRFIGFVAILLGIIALLLLWAWKADMPSYFSSWNQQFWRHDNPVRKEIKKNHAELLEEIRKVNDRLDTIETGDK